MANASRPNTYIIQSCADLGPEVRSYRCLFGAQALRFQPGQFSLVRLQKCAQLRAALTFATSPNEEIFEFVIKRTGQFGSAFYDQAKAGDLVSVGPPSGVLAVSAQEASQPLCFLGRDYTIPAARSVVRALELRGQAYHFTLIHEVSSTGDCLFENEFSSVSSERFRRIHLLMSDELEPGWRGARGPVSAELIRSLYSDLSSVRFLVQAEGIDAKRYRAVLEELGVDRSQMAIERWS